MIQMIHPFNQQNRNLWVILIASISANIWSYGHASKHRPASFLLDKGFWTSSWCHWYFFSVPPGTSTSSQMYSRVATTQWLKFYRCWEKSQCLKSATKKRVCSHSSYLKVFSKIKSAPWWNVCCLWAAALKAAIKNTTNLNHCTSIRFYAWNNWTIIITAVTYLIIVQLWTKWFGPLLRPERA